MLLVSDIQTKEITGLVRDVAWLPLSFQGLVALLFLPFILKAWIEITEKAGFTRTLKLYTSAAVIIFYAGSILVAQKYVRKQQRIAVVENRIYSYLQSNNLRIASNNLLICCNPDLDENEVQQAAQISTRFVYITNINGTVFCGCDTSKKISDHEGVQLISTLPLIGDAVQKEGYRNAEASIYKYLKASNLTGASNELIRCCVNDHYTNRFIASVCNSSERLFYARDFMGTITCLCNGKAISDKEGVRLVEKGAKE